MQLEDQIIIPVTWPIFEDLLEDRRNFWEGNGHREIPECIWEYVLDLIRDCRGLRDPWYNDPKYIVDNLIVNGSWRTFDDFREEAGAKDITDEELQEMLEERGDYVAMFPEERLILWNTGL